ncbi:transcriptional regulator [Desulfococcaceae bacterium HSG8]|nr:transcriptional regulator [Desulfococcaceae bacterium HSG8]
MPTIRQEMINLLSDGECSAQDISQILSIREKDVYPHLSHIAKSLASQKRKLCTVPPACLSCGFEFKTRKRFTRPGRCPRCKSERIREPRYRVD